MGMRLNPAVCMDVIVLCCETSACTLNGATLKGS